MTVVLIHYAWVPLWSYQVLRNWGLHFFALVAAGLLATVMIGYHDTTDARQQRMLRRIGVGAPLAVTLLHELGQWIWPVDRSDTFDSVRDGLLNVAGAMYAWWLLRRHGPTTVTPRQPRPRPRAGPTDLDSRN